MKAPHDPAPLAVRDSLRWRLPILISALITVVLVTFLWAAHRTVETTLVRAGGERAQSAADQVANLLDAQRTVEQLRRVATDADLRRFLLTPTDEAREAARNRLALLAPTGPRRVELWDDAGSRVLEISVLGTAAGGADPKVLPPGIRPSGVGVSALQASEGIVFYDAVAEIQDENSPTERTVTARRLGYLVIRATIAVSPPGIIGRLVGQDAVVIVGSRTSGIWTDFSQVVAAPGLDLTRNGVMEYRATNGAMRLGAAAKVRATPWVAWSIFRGH